MKNKHEIQKAQQSDIPDIVKIHRKCIVTTNSKHYPEEVIKEWVETINEKGVSDQITTTQWYVLKLTGQTIGFAQIDTGKGVLYQIHIDPDFQNQGYGKTLLNFLIGEFRNSGTEKITLLATLNAVPFYETNGFTRNEDTTIPLVKEFIDMVEMQRNL
ncbi:hypothetical protein A2380_00095 [candidate division WWE3 bacterium RIFOXYB1_FULL_43_24]|uniref:Acetyltransferase, gnat family n=2 Tax=Katanobacteria TaxID=422282 RepID=A0A0G0YIU4_UNCKA|nr:MAG: Acetyltransferase, gnat family [candidate division WWE3 bacterium GW2011_GWA1_42_12]KKS33547.1 MAG: Acetyltransferase, gnat family [candidate division WWE3 bacterium GW2011_GWD1_42_14]KKS36635.1 MAG: Acetyltransferase, gnat family [candidate division WWE3 bacterium GW2011_GWF1_42_14]KKS39702.1 MAG: Acetyltransferase, gnat family [candidate division WWE3 bacterium GW2011_GWE1_42_16]KKS65846.1 MAG: Acetyltransferase, gnat family [candidate division WWE3 bacterium GW2011_GWB1_42_6]OGC5957